MPKKRFSAEQIVTLLRQIEVSMACKRLQNFGRERPSMRPLPLKPDSAATSR